MYRPRVRARRGYVHGGGGGVPDASRTAASTTLAFFLPHTRTTHTVALRIRDSAMATASATRARDRGSVAGGAGTPAPLRVSGARGAPASRVAGGGRAGRGATGRGTAVPHMAGAGSGTRECMREWREVPNVRERTSDMYTARRGLFILSSGELRRDGGLWTGAGSCMTKFHAAAVCWAVGLGGGGPDSSTLLFTT